MQENKREATSNRQAAWNYQLSSLTADLKKHKNIIVTTLVYLRFLQHDSKS